MVSITIFISLTSLAASSYAILRSHRTGARKIDPQLKVLIAVDPAHAECASCHRIVARYNDQGVCVNCSPLK